MPAPALPDYDRSIVNLMRSVAAGLGAPSDALYPPLAELRPEAFAGRPVVLLVIDGLGRALLDEHPGSCLHRHACATLTSVFPSTTAAALTTFATAAAPQQHAITGWFMWLRELGSVAAILPFRPRHGGPVYGAVAPRALAGAAPLSERLPLPAAVVAPEVIVHSEFSRFSAGSAARHPHHGLDSMFATLARLVREGSPRYLFGYWPQLDTLAHESGVASREVRAHFRQIDAAFERFLDGIAGSGALVIATADHGLIDTAPERTLSLAGHPALAHCLTVPLCGEPRAAFCYVRPRRAAQFEAYVQGELGEWCELVTSERLIDEGWLGRGAPDARLADRIGDYLLLMRENRVVYDRLLTETPFTQVGVHGGLSRAELEVPLVVVER